MDFFGWCRCAKLTTVSVACSVLATPANAGDVTDEAPPTAHGQRTTWQELDERAREAYADESWRRGVVVSGRF